MSTVPTGRPRAGVPVNFGSARHPLRQATERTAPYPDITSAPGRKDDPTAIWTDYLGLPNSQRKLQDLRDEVDIDVRNFPEGLAGTSRALSAVIQYMVTNAQTFPSRRMFPIVKGDPGNDISWSLLTFPPTRLDQQPEQSSFRIVTTRMSKGGAQMLRWGKGFRMECGMMTTPLGQQIFFGSMKQISDATALTVALNCVIAALNPPYQNLPDKYKISTFDNLKAFDHAILLMLDEFNVAVKAPECLEAVLDNNAGVLVDRAGQPGDIWYLPRGVLKFATATFNAKYDVSAKGGLFIPPGALMQHMSRQYKCEIVEGEPFPQGDDREQTDPLFSDRVIGTFFLVDPAMFADIYSGKYTTAAGGVRVYNEDADDWALLLQPQFLQNSGLFVPKDSKNSHGRPPGTLSRELGEPIFGDHVTWGSWLQADGTLEQYANVIKNKPATRDAFLRTFSKETTAEKVQWPGDTSRSYFRNGPVPAPAKAVPPPPSGPPPRPPPPPNQVAIDAFRAFYEYIIQTKAADPAGSAAAKAEFASQMIEHRVALSTNQAEITKMATEILPLAKAFIDAAGPTVATTDLHWLADLPTVQEIGFDRKFTPDPSYILGNLKLLAVKQDAKAGLVAVYGRTAAQFPEANSAFTQAVIARLMAVSGADQKKPLPKQKPPPVTTMGSIPGYLLRPTMEHMKKLFANLSPTEIKQGMTDKDIFDSIATLVVSAKSTPTVLTNVLQHIARTPVAGPTRIEEAEWRPSGVFDEASSGIQRDERMVALKRLNHTHREPLINLVLKWARVQAVLPPSPFSDSDFMWAILTGLDAAVFKMSSDPAVEPALLRIATSLMLHYIFGAIDTMKDDAKFRDTALYRMLLDAERILRAIRPQTTSDTDALRAAASSLAEPVWRHSLVHLYEATRTERIAYRDSKRAAVAAGNTDAGYSRDLLHADPIIATLVLMKDWRVIPAVGVPDSDEVTLTIIKGVLMNILCDIRLPEFGFQYNLPPLIRYWCTREVDLTCGTGVYMKGGGDAGVTFLCSINMMMAPEMSRKVFGAHFSCRHAVAVTDPLLIKLNPNMIVRKYNRGNGINFYDPLNPEHRAAYRAGDHTIGCDIMVYVLAPGERIDATRVDITGRYDPSLGLGSLPLHLKNAPHYAKVWGHNHMHKAGNPFHELPWTDEATRPTLRFRDAWLASSCGENNGGHGLYDIEITNRGHYGRHGCYAGSGKTRQPGALTPLQRMNAWGEAVP